MTSFSPIEYLMIDAANQYGYDKKTFPQRIAWFKSLKYPGSKTGTAEKPAQYLAAVNAINNAKAGIPSGHLVGLDACASGIAILGILMGCHTTSSNTGVIGQKRMDMYHECTKEMAVDEFGRDEVKDAQMTHFYGSLAEPRNVFGEDTEELYAFYEAQEVVAPGACIMMRHLLGSWQEFALEHSCTLPDGFNNIVPVLEKLKAKIEIDELDHATLTYIYEDNVGSEFGLAVAANGTHGIDGFLVREVTRRCFYDREKLEAVQAILSFYHGLTDGSIPTSNQYIEQCAVNHKFISLRGIEFINEHNVMEFSSPYRHELLVLINEVLAKPSFPVLCVHDEFKCHANHMDKLRAIYQGILAELADSDVGQQTIRELRNDPTFVLTKLSDDLGTEIMKGEYHLS